MESNHTANEDILQMVTFVPYIRHVFLDIDEYHLRRHEPCANGGPNRRHRRTIAQGLQAITTAINKTGHASVGEWALRVAGCDISSYFMGLIRELGAQGSGIFNTLTYLELIDEALLHCSSTIFANTISTHNLPNLRRLRMEESGWFEKYEAVSGCDSSQEEEMKARKEITKGGPSAKAELILDQLYLSDNFGLLYINWMSDPSVTGRITVRHLQFYVNVGIGYMWSGFYSLLQRTSETIVQLEIGSVQMDQLIEELSTMFLPSLNTFGFAIRCKHNGLTGLRQSLNDNEQAVSKLFLAIKNNSVMPHLTTVIMEVNDDHDWICFPGAIDPERFSPGTVPLMMDDTSQSFGSSIDTSTTSCDVISENGTLHTLRVEWNPEKSVQWPVLDDAFQLLASTTQSDTETPSVGLRALIIPISAGPSSSLSEEQKQVVDRFLNLRFPKSVSRGISVVSEDSSIRWWHIWKSA
ncbi:hypothetical protein CVT24_006320 [Panaeolus cyanescens]|uniref:Uncharacterized protein n=1 Tax=Panaeolus cyanescens TaxID=181874 RepID=A0A409X581_9AGAR|nr:hypothetical protein CVT24_006320 [Panaeolus cyanescens]